MRLKPILLFIGLLSLAPAQAQMACPQVGLPSVPSAQLVQYMTEPQNICAPLSPGQGRRQVGKVNEHAQPTQYLMERDSRGNYQASLSLDFLPEYDFIDAAIIRPRVEECLSTVRPYLRGPDGQMLTIKLLSSAQLNALPPNLRPDTQNITVQGSRGTRSGYLNYAENIKCDAIIHEIFHLMGLADEYKEVSRSDDRCRPVMEESIMGMSRNYFEKTLPTQVSCDCSSEPCKSIMASGDARLIANYTDTPSFQGNPYCDVIAENSATTFAPARVTADSGLRWSYEQAFFSKSETAPFFTLKRSTFQCQCERGDHFCARLKQRQMAELASGRTTPKSYCPEGAREISRSQVPRQTAASVNGGVFNFPVPTIHSSLIQPNQFNRLIGGDCPNTSPNYQACAAHAYESEGVMMNCKTPLQCFDPAFYLGTR